MVFENQLLVPAFQGLVNASTYLFIFRHLNFGLMLRKFCYVRNRIEQFINDCKFMCCQQLRNMYMLLVNSIIHENGKQLKNNVTAPVRKCVFS